MNKTKQNYLSPTTETLVVRFEENILSYKANSANHTEYLTGGADDDYEEL